MTTRVISHADVAERPADCAREIRAMGVSRLALFGSVLRGQSRLDNDVDVLVQFAPGAKTYTRCLALGVTAARAVVYPAVQAPRLTRKR